jgi:hypothetical protein
MTGVAVRVVGLAVVFCWAMAALCESLLACMEGVFAVKLVFLEEVSVADAVGLAGDL